MNWAYVHLFLNHIPVVGIVFGVLFLLFAVSRKSEDLKRVSMGIFVFTALIALPVYFTGEPAEELVEHLPGVSEALIEQHEKLALFSVVAAGITGIAALSGLVIFRRAGNLPNWIMATTLFLSVVTSGLMGLTANFGGQIRHTEIRTGFTAPAETQRDAKPGAAEGGQKVEREKEHDE